jgi:hypothetical protein
MYIILYNISKIQTGQNHACPGDWHGFDDSIKTKID